MSCRNIFDIAWLHGRNRIKADKGLPKMFERYNGKPTLMTKSSRIVQGPGYFEMDVRFLNTFRRNSCAMPSESATVHRPFRCRFENTQRCGKFLPSCGCSVDTSRRFSAISECGAILHALEYTRCGMEFQRSKFTAVSQ